MKHDVAKALAFDCVVRRGRNMVRHENRTNKMVSCALLQYTYPPKFNNCVLVHKTSVPEVSLMIFL